MEISRASFLEGEFFGGYFSRFIIFLHELRVFSYFRAVNLYFHCIFIWTFFIHLCIIERLNFKAHQHFSGCSGFDYRSICVQYVSNMYPWPSNFYPLIIYPFVLSNRKPKNRKNSEKWDVAFTLQVFMGFCLIKQLIQYGKYSHSLDVHVINLSLLQQKVIWDLYISYISTEVQSEKKIYIFVPKAL